MSSALLGSIQITVQAQVPAEVPQNVAAAQRARLNVEKAGLETWRGELKAKVIAHNSKCTGVTANTPLDNQCRQENASLQNEKTKYYAAVKKFNADVAAAIRVTAATRPAASPTPHASEPESAVNMNELYPQEVCEEAKKNVTKLQSFKTGLEAKLEELGRWRGDLQRYSKEFDDLHADAIRHDLSDILNAIPASETLGKLAKAKYVTPETAHDFSVAYKSLTALASQNDAFTTSDDTRKLKKTLDATLGVQKIIASIPFRSIPKDDPNRKVVERTMFAIDAFAKVIVFAQKGHEPGEKPSSFFEQVRDYAPSLAGLSLDLAAAYPGEVALIAKPGRYGKDEYIKYRKNQIANEALESLGAALASNWDAKLQLGQRLDKVKADIGEEERILQGCQMR